MPTLVRQLSAPLLRAPFTWHGGKARVTDVVWEHFGDVSNYAEPFCGSAAMLLGAPSIAKREDDATRAYGAPRDFPREAA